MGHQHQIKVNFQALGIHSQFAEMEIKYLSNRYICKIMFTETST